MIETKIKCPDNFLQAEDRDGYTVSKESKEVWAIELDLLSEFDRVAKKYNLKYFAIGGTLLGAVRHKGFIPWDDDVDIIMPWKDYKIMCDKCQQEFHFPYFFQTGYNDPGSLRGHAQLRNSLTTAMRVSEKEKKLMFNQGIFIDIFCIDNVPDDEKKRKVFLKSIIIKRNKLLNIANISSRYNKTTRKRYKPCKRVLLDGLHFFYHIMGTEKRKYLDFETTLHRYNESNTKQGGIISLIRLKEKCIWDNDDLNSEIIRVPFEFVSIPIPQKYDSILSKHYGNWKAYEIGKNTHGDLFIDTEHTYKDYI